MHRKSWNGGPPPEMGVANVPLITAPPVATMKITVRPNDQIHFDTDGLGSSVALHILQKIIAGLAAQPVVIEKKAPEDMDAAE